MTSKLNIRLSRFSLFIMPGTPNQDNNPCSNLFSLCNICVAHCLKVSYTFGLLQMLLFIQVGFVSDDSSSKALHTCYIGQLTTLN